MLRPTSVAACLVVAAASMVPLASARVVEHVQANESGAVLSYCDDTVCLFLEVAKVMSRRGPGTLVFYNVTDYATNTYRQGYGVLSKSTLTGTLANGMTFLADTSAPDFVNETCDTETWICTVSSGGILRASWKPNGLSSYSKNNTSKTVFPGLTLQSSGMSKGVSATASLDFLGLYSVVRTEASMYTTQGTTMTIEKP